MTIVDRIQLVGTPGSAVVLGAELARLCRRALGALRRQKPVKLGPGAVAFPFDPRVAAVALRFHRTSSRILWDLYESRASRLESLHDELRGAVAGDTRDWCAGARTLSIRPRNLKGFPAGVRQVVGAVKNAVIAGLKARGIEMSVSPDAPEILLSVRRHDDRIIVSVDLHGASRHQRGYRVEAGDAPLRENLAATLLMLARYDPRRDLLVDPCAGSGTIAIEAALMARGQPLDGPSPRWPAIAAAGVPTTALWPDARPRIVAIEIDPEVAGAARRNAERARAEIEVITGDLRESRPPALAPDERGLILCNPPYGRRLEGQADLAAELGQFAAAVPGYRVGALTEERHFERRFEAGYRRGEGRRSTLRSSRPLPNASAPTRFLLFDRD